MLHEQQLKDEQQLKYAAMAADESMHIKTLAGLGLNLGPLAPKADVQPLSY